VSWLRSPRPRLLTGLSQVRNSYSLDRLNGRIRPKTYIARKEPQMPATREETARLASRSAAPVHGIVLWKFSNPTHGLERMSGYLDTIRHMWGVSGGKL
jgi:hypothetical protein